MDEVKKDEETDAMKTYPKEVWRGSKSCQGASAKKQKKDWMQEQKLEDKQGRRWTEAEESLDEVQALDSEKRTLRHSKTKGKGS